MQYTAIFHGCKTGNFSMKKCYILLIFAQNIDRGYTLEEPQCTNEYQQSMYRAKNKKKMKNPCKPQFYCIKVGCKTAITLTPPTVDLSADKMPDFSSSFIGRQKINYNYLFIYFFSIGRQFWGFGNRPMIGR